MHRIASTLVAITLSLGLFAPALGQETYKVDPVHSSAVFRIKHANTAFFWGRFNEPAGTFALDPADPTKSSFKIELQANKVDTGNAQRDGHLKSPDFFNAKQYPTITFTSKSVKQGEGNLLQITGDLTLHGVTKPITASVEPTGTGEMRGRKLAGVEATLLVKMSDFEIKGMPGGLSDEVKVIISLEGQKQ